MLTLRRHPITLLELIVVIAIIASISAVVAINVNKALVEQRFKTEVGQIVDELRLAQDLMLVLGRDVHVKFAVKKNKDGIEYWIDNETALSDNVQKEVSGRKRSLKTIKGVFLKDELLTEEVSDLIDVKFFSKGAVMSKGTMRLATTDKEPPPAGTLENYICLPGFPMPIASSDTLELAEARCKVDTTDDMDRLTHDTMRRLPDKLKKKDGASTGVNPENPVGGDDSEKKGSSRKKQGDK